jgi:PAS domain S-box-containing protein
MQSQSKTDERAAQPSFKLLILEDVITDAELEQHVLRKAGLTFATQQVSSEAAFVASLAEFAPDIIIADYQVPGFCGFEAARLARAERPDMPVILVTGVLGDDAAAELLKTGISDYVLKDHLARLPAAVMGALRDAEEACARRRIQAAHDELARILECATDAVIGVDFAGVVTAWNASAASIYGWSAGEAIGRPLRQALNGGYTRALDHALARALERGEPTSLEANYRARNGKILAVSLSLSAVVGADGAGRGASIIVRDVTRQKQLQIQLERTSAQLAQSLDQISQTNLALQREIEVRREAEEEAAHARQQAEQANEAKTSFMSHVSHEIRTPMTSIIGFADLLLDTPLSGDQAQKVRHVQSAARSLLAVINDVLDISGVESGRLRLESAPTNVRSVIESVLATVRPAATAKSLYLRWSAAANVADWVEADPARLRQILLNLVSNALKFTEQGGATVSVTRDPDRAGHVLRFEVCDTGIGIPFDKQHCLFREFYRVRHAGGREVEGSGLGLAISKRLVEIMGGSIGVTSREGKGSTFWFEVSLQRTAAAPLPKSEPESVRPETTGRLLVAEDLPMNQMIIAEMLERRAIRFGWSAMASAQSRRCARRRSM